MIPSQFMLMHTKNGLEHDESLFLAIRLFDRLMNSDISICFNNYRLLATACFMLAEKSEEIYTTDTASLLTQSGLEYNRNNA